MIDTGANKCIMHESLAPEEFRTKLGIDVGLRQFNGSLLQITECIINVPIRINGEVHNLPQTLITKHMSSYKFILGLNFILGNNGSMLITPSGVNFFKKSTFIQPKLETSNNPYIKKISNIEKPIDLECFDSLLEDSIVNLELEPEQVLSYEEIDEYLMESYTEDICVVSKIESNQENT